MASPINRDAQFVELSHLMAEVGKSAASEAQKPYIKLRNNKLFVVIKGRTTQEFEADKLAKTIENVIFAADGTRAFAKEKTEDLEGLIRGLETLRTCVQLHQEKMFSGQLKTFFLGLFGYRDPKHHDSVIERINSAIEVIKQNIVQHEQQTLKRDITDLEEGLKSCTQELEKLSFLQRKAEQEKEAQPSRQYQLMIDQHLVAIEYEMEEVMKRQESLATQLALKKEELNKQLGPVSAGSTTPNSDTALFFPKNPSIAERRVMEWIKDALGIDMERPTETHAAYQRRVIFGFSMGQKAAIRELSHDSDFTLEDLHKILEGADSVTNMYYVAHLLESLIPQVKAKGKDPEYLASLQQLQADLKRSLPIAFKCLVIATSQTSLSFHDQPDLQALMNQINQKQYEEDFDSLSTLINQTLDEMKTGDRLMIPTGILGKAETGGHATLLSLRKNQKGEIIPTLYNTGAGVEEHKTKGLNLISLSHGFASQEEQFPTSMTYPPIHLPKDTPKFKKMMQNLLKMNFVQENSTISEMNRELSQTLGKGKPGKLRRVQINGVCSFQVMTEELRSNMGSKKNYKKFQLDLLNSIQKDFRQLTSMIHPTTQEKEKMLQLHQKLLTDNRRLIRKREKRLGI